VDEDGNNERLEEWYFHDQGTSITFYNGDIYMFGETDPLPENSIIAAYEPKHFESDLRWQDILEKFGQQTWVKASEFLPDLFTESEVELYYSEQIVVGIETETNNIVYVETMILATQEEEEES
jgi:hypothetical protein